MRNLSKLLAVSAASAGVMLASAPAHALTFVNSLAPSTLSLPLHPSAVIPSNTIIQNTNTYDFTFSTLGGTYSSVMQAQASKVKNGAPATLAFALFSGSPGTGTWIANSGGTPTAATLRLNLGPGNYYLELGTHNAPKELLTGGITLLSAVPEPASWAVMLVGVAGLGAMTRTRRRALATAAI
jgi:hypothetical protein